MPEIKIGVANLDPASDLYRRTVRHFPRAFLYYAPVLSGAVAIVASGMLVDLALWSQSPFQANFSKASLIVSMFYILISRVLGEGAVSLDTRASVHSARSAVAWSFALTLIVAVAFVLKVSGQYSRIGAFLFVLAGFVAVPLSNLFVARFIAKRVKARSIAFVRVQIVTLEEYSTSAESVWCPSPGVELTGRHSVPISASDFVAECRKLRAILQRATAEGRCDQIVLVALWQEKGHIATLLRELGPLPSPVILLSDPALIELYKHRRIMLGDNIGFELQSAPLGWSARGAKRALDLSVAVAAIVLFGPLMLLSAAALWLETGSPIFFYQDRRGFGGVPFKIIKFRSMTVSQNGDEIPQAMRQDPRVTAVGRILRRTSVDELPQLFNVLKGEMSIVGPRPHAVTHDDYYDQFIEHYAFRHHVKPGITGWAQVNGLRGATETTEAMQRRVEYDLWYINHWSLWLDVKIILRTAFNFFGDDNAY